MGAVEDSPTIARQRDTVGRVAAYRAAQRAIDIGAEVRRFRRARGWTQTDLAARTGISRSALARLETGVTVPTLSALERLAEALSIEVTVSLRRAAAPIDAFAALAAPPQPREPGGDD